MNGIKMTSLFIYYSYGFCHGVSWIMWPIAVIIELKKKKKWAVALTMKRFSS